MTSNESMLKSFVAIIKCSGTNLSYKESNVSNFINLKLIVQPLDSFDSSDIKFWEMMDIVKCIVCVDGWLYV